MTLEIKNARISGTFLGIGDHGILTCMIQMEYDGSGQGFGGWSFDAPPKNRLARSRRRGTAFGMEFIARVVWAVGVDSWEDLKGEHVRVEADHNHIERIGHIIEDRWFDPAKDLKEFIAKEEKPSVPAGKKP